MHLLRFLEDAEADLERILRYVSRESGSVGVGMKFTNELRSKCRELAASPFSVMGRPRDELHPHLRSHAHKGYVIFFRYCEDRFEVVNILEGHRDIDSFYDTLKEDPTGSQ